MTNEIEKQFFDTFGIEARLDCKRCEAMNFALGQCAEVDCKYGYPQITDRILLELICIDNQENIYKCRPFADNVEELKTYILEEFIRLYELGLFKRANQVRTLFEES